MNKVRQEKIAQWVKTKEKEWGKDWLKRRDFLKLRNKVHELDREFHDICQ